MGSQRASPKSEKARERRKEHSKARKARRDPHIPDELDVISKASAAGMIADGNSRRRINGWLSNLMRGSDRDLCSIMFITVSTGKKHDKNDQGV
jgi:hypothetical protein